MESKVTEIPKRVLKKVKDFENVHDYFNYATTEFGNENIQFAGYKWAADDLFDLYLAGDKEAVLKLALPESTDFSDLPFIKSNYDKPDRPPLKGKFTAEDTVKFPCKPAQECVEKYFEAKEWDDKLMEHPRFMNLWPNRHLDLGFAKVQLMDAKQNLANTKQKYEESLAEMGKDKDELKEKAEKLREFTITFNNLAFRNIYKRVESEKKINADMELNFKKLQKGKKMMEKIEKMIVAQEDLKDRIEKMQIYEDFLTRVVESSAGKYVNIQQILNRYDSVAFTKRQIVRNHMEDMFKLDVLQEKLRRFISERQDIVRNYNNQIGNLARRYKFVQKRYFHWENAVQRMKKLCNRERAQTQSVEASIWNLYVQMCVRKKMPVKEKKGDYKTQLAYILITIKQYEKIVQIAEQKYELYLRSRTNSSMSVRKKGDKKEEIPVETETTFWIKKSVGTQTRDVNLVEASTMIWWEDEVQMTTSAIPSSQDTEEEKPLEVENSKMEVSSTVEEEKKITDQTTLVEEPELLKQIIPSSNPKQSKLIKVSKSTKEPKVRLIYEQKTLQGKQEQTQKLQEKTKSSKDTESTRRIETSKLPKSSKSSKQMDVSEKPGQRLDKLELVDDQSKPITDTVKESIISEPCEEKPLLDLDIDTGIAIQTDEIETQDKSHQYELFVSVHCQTLTDSELQELQELQQQMDAEKTILEADEQEMAWLKQATELNTKLTRPSRKKSVQVRTRETKSSFVKLESAGSVHSGESIKSRGLEEWDDSAAGWFYPQEWGESLEWEDEEEEESVEVQQEFRKESPDFILGTGRRTSAAMKELSIVMYPSQRKDSVLSYTAPMQARDQRESTAGRDSLRELEPPMWGESVVDGILRRLQEALANKGECIDGGGDRRESVWTEQTKSSMEKEEMTQVRVARYEKDESRKSEIKPKEKQVPDYGQTYLKDMNLVDAWTQTPCEQTEDWVQTLPVKVQYGWSQTEKIDQMIQTDLDGTEKMKKLSMSVDYTEVSTQTDVSSEEKKPTEVEPEEEEELKSPETRKLSVQLKSLGPSTTELQSAESVEEKTLLKRTQLSPNAPSTSLQDPSLPKSAGSRKKSSKMPTSATLTKAQTSVESDNTLVSKQSTVGVKSLKPLKSATKKKSFTGVKSTTAAQTTMITMKEAISSLTADQEDTTLKKSKSKRSKELPRLSLKKTPLKPLVGEVSTLQPLVAVPKIARPCKQAIEKSVSLDKISEDIKKENKRCLHRLKMMSKSKLRVTWSRQKPDTSKSLLPDIFTEMSSLSSSSSSTITKPSKKPITKEKFQLDDLIERLSKNSLDTQEEFPSLSSFEEKQWSYASSTSSADLRKPTLEEI